MRRTGGDVTSPCGSPTSLFGTLPIRYCYIAAGGDEGSYLLIRKMALVGQATIHAPSPMQFSGRTGLATPSTMSSTFGPSFLHKVTQFLHPMQRTGGFPERSLLRISFRKLQPFLLQSSFPWFSSSLFARLYDMLTANIHLFGAEYHLLLMVLLTSPFLKLRHLWKKCNILQELPQNIDCHVKDESSGN